MNRSCFALSVLLGSLAISLIALDAARGIANEIECGFYPDWQTIASEADQQSRWAVVELRTHYDRQYDDAVYGDHALAHVESPVSEEPEDAPVHADANSDFCHETWAEYTCGHDWITEEYQPYDYVEDHCTAATSTVPAIADLDEVVAWTQSVVESTRAVEISPGSWIRYVSQKTASTVANSQWIQSIESHPATVKPLDDIAGWPEGPQQSCDEWDCWYDTGCDWDDQEPVVQADEPVEVQNGSARFGQKLTLLVARALDSTGRSLREASAYMVEMSGVEVTELSWNPHNSRVEQQR